jgi:hypothetical protein
VTRLAAALALWLGLIWAGAAAAHEVRPAYLEIDQTGPATYAVTWKQPTMGDVAIHLAPHLTGGWLEAEPTDQYAADGFLIKQWTVAGQKPKALEGQTVSVDGLADTITDVYVRARLADGRGLERMLRPQEPQTKLAFEGGVSGGLVSFLVLGVQHILSGPDHLLFVLGLLLIVRDRWMLVKTVTAFTAAHSLTLVIATLGHIQLPGALLNALVALSILFVAPEAIRAAKGGASLTIRHTWVVAFAFGLLHGLGFANGLTTLGLSKGELVPALALFNLGVEIGQLAFLALVFALRRSFRLMALSWPRAIQQLPAYAIGALGAMWTVQYGAIAVGIW